MATDEDWVEHGPPTGRIWHESEDRFWSIVFNVDEAIVSGAPLPTVDDPELSDEALERLRGIKDCLMLLSRSRAQLQTDEWRMPFDTSSRELERLFEAGAEPPGPRFGRFEIVNKLGEGGSGMVYLAIDPKLDRKVALKIPLPAWLLSGDLSRRFVREARFAAQLAHRNIVSIYEVGEIEPFSYIASEYCEGHSLANWLAGGHRRAAPREAAEFTAALCDAAQYAHSHGLLHRDIKPSNILLAHADRNEEEATRPGGLSQFIPKIADFGLAKLMEDADDLTRTGAIVGTLRYLAPEQADGRVADVSVQTDVYALGAVLYELLTGQAVHQGATNAETLQRILLADVVPPRRLNPAVPPDLNAVCLKALEKSPERRYSTAAEFREDLQRFVRRQPVRARETSIAERVYRWVRRRPALAALGFVSIAAIVTLIASTLAYNNRLVTAAANLRREVNANSELLYTRDVQIANDAWHAHHVNDALEALESQVPAAGETDRREFGWRYLWNQCHAELATLGGHEGDVYHVAFAPDGRALASAGRDRTVRVWDIPAGKPIATLTGHEGEVNTVVFVSQDLLASASDDGAVRLWDLTTGKQVGVLDAHDGAVFGLAVTADGRTLASGGQGARVHLWNVAERTELWASPPTVVVEGLAITSDSQTLVSGHADASVRCWNLSSREVSVVDPSAATSQVSVACSQDLALFAIASRTGQLATYRQTGPKRWSQDGSAALDTKAIGIHALAFSPRDNTLATGTRDGLLELWDVGQRRLVPGRYLPGHRSRVWSVAWSPDGRLLASSAASGDIKLWDPINSNSVGKQYPRQPSPVCSIAIASGSIISTGNDGQLREWSPAGRFVRRFFSVPKSDTSLVATSADDAASIVSASLRTVQTINLQTGAVNQVAELPETVCSLAISTDGRIAAIGCEHKTAMLFDAQTWRLLHRLSTRALDGRCVALNQDGSLLATAGGGAEIEIWDTATGRVEHVLPGHFTRTSCLAFLPDSRTLVSGGTNEQICFWDARTGQLQTNLIGRPSTINALAVSPDGRTLATGSFSPAWIDLWDLQTKGKLVELENFGEPILTLAFSTDGNSLFAGTAGGDVIEWSVNDEQEPRGATSEHSAINVAGYVPVEHGDNDPPPANAAKSNCVDSLLAVCEYASKHGFVAGYPTFNSTTDDSPTVETVLFRPSNTKAVFVSFGELRKRQLVLQSDYRTQSELLDSLLLQADQWGVAKGYKGALPTGRCEIGDDGSMHYECIALFRSGFARRRMKLAQASDARDTAALFRKVHEWSVDAGFISGFPTGRVNNLQIDCVLVTAEQAEIRDVPKAALALDNAVSFAPAGKRAVATRREASPAD